MVRSGLRRLGEEDDDEDAEEDARAYQEWQAKLKEKARKNLRSGGLAGAMDVSSDHTGSSKRALF